MKTAFRTYLISFVLGLLGLCIIYIWIFEKSLGKPIGAEWWVKSALDYKEYRSSSIETNKLIVLSGSNALFGIESPVLQEFTRLPVINMASHAELRFDYFYHLIDKHLNKGDTLVMPLEYEYYYREDVYSWWFTAQMVAWGKDSYLQHLDSLEHLKFISATSPEVLWHAHLQTASGNLTTPENAIRQVIRHNKYKHSLFEGGYSHLNLNLFGDIRVELPHTKVVTDIINIEGDRYIKKEKKITDFFIDDWKRIQALAAKKGARLVLTWPVSIRNKDFDLRKEEHQLIAKKFSEQLEKNGIQIQCEPALFNLNHKLFFDSRYHLNAKGARLRSIVLGDCLRTILSGKEPKDLDDNLVVSKVMELEEQFIKMKFPLPQ